MRAQLKIHATDEREAREVASRWDAHELDEGVILSLDDGLPIEIDSEPRGVASSQTHTLPELPGS